MAKKVIAWNKIKAEYLQGVTPKELAAKYNLKPKQISDKANEEKWVAEKAKVSENVRENVQEKIQELSNLALDTLAKVINDPRTKKSIKVSACKAILDVSGLKSIKQEVSGVEGVSVIINREAVHVESNN